MYLRTAAAAEDAALWIVPMDPLNPLAKPEPASLPYLDISLESPETPLLAAWPKRVEADCVGPYCLSMDVGIPAMD